MIAQYVKKMINPRNWILVALSLGMSSAFSCPGFTEQENLAFKQTLDSGAALYLAGNPLEAISEYDKVISAHELKSNGQRNFYYARNQGEVILYSTLFIALRDIQTGIPYRRADADKITDVCAFPYWPYALYMKGSSLIEMSKFSEAKPSLIQAVDFMPMNSSFLNELAVVYQSEKNWGLQRQIAEQMEKAVKMEKDNGLIDQKKHDSTISRAWRSIAFALIEQGQLDEAESYYKKCLDLDKNDARALHELKYIEQLRSKQRAQ